MEKAVLLTSLIIALDKVDNSVGHFSSYLKEWSPRSYKTMNLKVPLITKNEKEHIILQNDIFKILDKVKCDLAYFDPPYGSNNEKMPPSRIRYAAYYHLWTTICLNDHPQLFGKAKRRVDSSDKLSGSVFEEFKRGSSGRFIVVEAIEKLIRNTNARYIILSYSSGGRATAEELKEVLENSGHIIDVVTINYKKNVMSNMRWTNEWIRNVESPNKEYLFLLEKGEVI